MYISDQKTTNMLAILVLVAGPWLGVSKQAWGWTLDILLLLALLWVGRSDREHGLRFGTIFLFSGYGLAVLLNGFPSYTSFSFVPWAGLVTIWGMRAPITHRAVVFWSLVAAGVTGIIPTLGMLLQGVAQDSVQVLVQSLMDQYTQAGMLENLKSQGVTERELLTLFEQIANTMITLTPGLVALTSLAKWGAVYYFFVRWFPFPERAYQPFTEWRLPWYAVWGMNLAIASYLVGDLLQWLTVKHIGLNLMLVYGVVALILGSAIFVSFLKKPMLSVFVKFILLFASFLYIQVTAPVLIIMGLLDLVFDFRRRSTPKKKE